MNHQEGMKRRWDEKRHLQMNPSPFHAQATPLLPPPPTLAQKKFLGLSSRHDEDDVASTVVPPVTVVLEGRSICHRIYLNKHSGYESFAAALRSLFVDDDGQGANGVDSGVDLSNAVPGYLVAYEDMEDDLLLAGDLSWKDFVRVVKRIRIIPAKMSGRRRSVEAKCD